MIVADDFFSPDNAVARLDDITREEIRAAAVQWVDVSLEDEHVDLSAMLVDAFIAGAAWAKQYRWE